MKTPIDKWSLLALARFALAFIVASAHLAAFVPLGWLAFVPVFGMFEPVLCFLLISGYSIGNSYGKEPDGFLKRRAWRIYPVYIAAIVLTCFAIPQPWRSGAVTIAQNLLFLNQVTTERSFIGPAWSLSLAVWLYCLTPFLGRLKSEHLRAVMYASFAAFCCYEVCRSAFHLPYYVTLSYGLNLPLLAYIWLGGFLLARAPSLARRTVRDCGVMLFGEMLLQWAIAGQYRSRHTGLDAFIQSDLAGLAGRTATVAAIWLLFKWIADGRTGKTRSTSMRLLGDISYPLYLVHAGLFILVANVGIRSPEIYLGAAVVTALLIYWCIDFYGRARERTSHSPAVTVAAEAGR